MVQYLSINFFVGFFKRSRFLCLPVFCLGTIVLLKFGLAGRRPVGR